MDTDKISIIDYNSSWSADLLWLLLDLHETYFHQNASKQIQELRAEHDLTRAYEGYIRYINEHNDKDWKIFIAVTNEGKPIGFIIGSIAKEDELVRGNIGKLEDWLVADAYRGQSIGKKLYQELENWFKIHDCDQVISDTWYGNELSIRAHQQLGFFITGLSFGKRLK